MDPNTAQPQGDSQNLQKLEEDLQKLSKEAEATSQSSGPVSQPQVPAVPPAPQPQSATPPATGETNGSSIVMKIAISLLAIALVAVIIYALMIKFGPFGTSQVTPTITPQTTEIPLPSIVGESATPSGSPMATASASPLITPSGSPSASPTSMP